MTVILAVAPPASGKPSDDVAHDDLLSEALLEILSQNHPGKLLPNSSPTILN